MECWSAWTTSGQSHGLLFSQDTNGSSCLSSEALNCSLRGTSPVSLLDSDWWALWGAACGGTLLHMIPQGHGGQRWFGDDGQQQMVLTLRDSARHDGLVNGCFVCGLGGLQDSVGLLWWWYAVQGIGLVGAGIMYGLVWVAWWQLFGVLHMDMLCGLWCWWEGLEQRAKASKTWWNYYVWAADAWIKTP